MSSMQNTFEWVNPDPSISEFKHHFLLRRVHIPKMQFQEFCTCLYRGFRSTTINSKSVQIVQIVDTYDNSLYDLAVGLRKDSQAIALYKQTKKFYSPTREADVELAQAFKLYYDFLLSSQPKEPEVKPDIKMERTDSRQESRSGQERQRSQNKSQKQDLPLEYKKIKSKSPVKRSASRSRSRERPYRREELSGTKLFLLLLPSQFRRERIEQRLCEIAQCSSSDLSCEERGSDFPCMQVSVRSPHILNALTYEAIDRVLPMCLILKQEEILGSTLRLELRRHQVRATKLNLRQGDDVFGQLLIGLAGIKEIRVIHVQPLEGCFIVTVRERAGSREMRLRGWRFEPVAGSVKMIPSLQDRWHTHINRQSDNRR